MEIHNSYIFIKSKKGQEEFYSQEESFYYFLKNSKTELLSDTSAFSFIYKCTFKKNPNKSPYYYFNSKNEIKNVTKIVIKCLLLNDRKDDTSYDDYIWYYKKSCGEISKKYFEIKKRFMEEIRIQTECSQKTFKCFNRNVPVVLYSNIFENSSSFFKMMDDNYAIKIMLNEYDNKTHVKNKSWLHYFQSCFTNQNNRKIENQKENDNEKQKENNDTKINYYFGIIAMEYIPSNYKIYYDLIKHIIIDEIKAKPEYNHIYKYDSLTLSEKSIRLRWLYNIARYDILRLAIDTGYTQGDYHTDNLFVDEELQRTIIIDFGKASKIYNKDGVLSLPIKDNIANLQTILKRIFYTTFNDDKKCDEFIWLKNIDEYDYDIILFLDEYRRHVL